MSFGYLKANPSAIKVALLFEYHDSYLTVAGILFLSSSSYKSKLSVFLFFLTTNGCLISQLA